MMAAAAVAEKKNNVKEYGAKVVAADEEEEEAQKVESVAAAVVVAWTATKTPHSSIETGIGTVMEGWSLRQQCLRRRLWRNFWPSSVSLSRPLARR